MKVAIQSFFGVAPKIAPRYLPDGAAQVAINVEAFGQSLKPLRGTEAVVGGPNLGGAQTIYKFGQDNTTENAWWFSWGTDVDVCRSQIAGDGTAEWTFYSGDGYPKATYEGIAKPGPPLPAASLRLGLPAPVTPLKGVVGQPEYCEIDGERDTSLDTKTLCEASGFCEVDGVRNDTYKTKATCEAQTKGVWTPGVWIKGSKLSPATITLTPAILAQVNSTFGLDLSTDNGTSYKKVKPSSAGAPQIWINSSHLVQMVPEYPLRVSLDNERTWAAITLPNTVCQRAEAILYVSEMPMGYYPFIVRVTGGAYPREFTRPFSQGSLPGMATSQGVASEINRWAADLDYFVTAVVRNGNVHVTTRSLGADVTLYIQWGSNAYRSANGASLVQAQDAFIAALAAAKIDSVPLATATRTATDQVTVTATRAGSEVTLVLRWGDADSAKLAQTGTASNTGALVTAINAIVPGGTYTGAKAVADGDDIVVTSTVTGKDAKLRIRWGEGTTSYRSATGVTEDLGTKETRVYTYTWVLKQGDMEWESTPWTVTTMPTYDVYPGGSVTLTGFEAASVLTANGWGPTSAGTLHYRIYRAVNGVYLYVDEKPAPLTSYVDLKDADELGEELPSLLWTPPPANLRGMLNLPNGMIAGFYGRELHFCEPYRPYAWPDTYAQVVDYPVVGLGRMDTTLAVLTTGVPYFIQGSAPDVAVMVKSDIEQACVSKRSIVSIGGAVFYASPDGLMMLSSSGSDILTKDLMDRDAWQALTPSSIIAYGHDSQYVAFHDAVTDKFGNVTSGFVLDLKSKQFVRHNLTATCGFNDLRTDQLYLVVGGQLVKWGEGGYLTGKWRSKLFSQPQMTGFACAQVESAPLYDEDNVAVTAPAYPVTTRIYADQRLFYTWTVSASDYYSSAAAKLLAQRNPFRLPPRTGFLGRDWEIELDVTQEIFNVALAQAMSEIAST